MSATGQPYSDRALEAASCQFGVPQALDAAHDREALGLDASVCAREFLNEMVRTVLAAVAMTHPCTFPKSFVEDPHWGINDPVGPDEIRDTVVDAIMAALREFESNGGKP